MVRLYASFPIVETGVYYTVPGVIARTNTGVQSVGNGDFYVDVNIPLDKYPCSYIFDNGGAGNTPTRIIGDVVPMPSSGLTPEQAEQLAIAAQRAPDNTMQVPPFNTRIVFNGDKYGSGGKEFIVSQSTGQLPADVSAWTWTLNVGADSLPMSVVIATGDTRSIQLDATVDFELGRQQFFVRGVNGADKWTAESGTLVVQGA